MVDQRITRCFRVTGVLSLVLVGLLAVGSRAQAKNGPPGNNPGRPFAEILAQIGVLNEKLNELLEKSAGGLRGVTQNWDKKLDSTNGDANGCNSDRFTCLFGGAAVRDNQTGLVWEQFTQFAPVVWTVALHTCTQRTVGGLKGWRVPSIHELASLVDPSQQSPAFPLGYPFNAVPGEY